MASAKNASLDNMKKQLGTRLATSGMFKRRVIAFALLGLVMAVAFRFVSTATGSVPLGAVAASLASLPILLVMRCSLDRC